MRCEYVEVPAKIPDKFASFQCKYCAKKTTIPLAMKERFGDIASRMPDCDSAGTPATTPAAPPPPPPAEKISALNLAGPGTQLKRMLSKVGIKATPNCSCNARARKMDEMGIEWCEQNVNEIVGWLKEEAQRRNLPFLAFPTKILIQRAISAARRVRASQQAESSSTPEETST
jgi:hypothetical protein